MDYDTIINDITALLEHEQRDNGSFLSYSSPYPDNLKNGSAFHTVFSSSLILSCLNKLPRTKNTIHISQKIAGFLKREISTYGTANYWAKDSKEYRILSYPDDFDDTFCALSALYEYDKKILSSTLLAHVISLLTEYEVKEGGPYKTWIVNDSASALWKDVDIVVNSNIAYFFSLTDIQLDNIVQLTEKAISSRVYYSPYYPSEIPVLYFICRWYRGEKTDELSDYVRTALSETDNIMNKALLISSLLYIDDDIETCSRHVAELSRTIISEIHAYPFYRGVNVNNDKKKCFAGSQALTSAFCLEMLGLFRSRSALAKNKRTINITKDNVQNTIYESVADSFQTYSEDIQSELSQYVRRILLTDAKHPISLLPYLFQNSLHDPSALPIKLVRDLGIAHVYGWLAYTIYDDISDDRKNCHLLPVAGILSRMSIKLFCSWSPEKSFFQDVCCPVFDAMDSASVQDMSQSSGEKFSERYYDTLSKRSKGHILPAYTILSYLRIHRSSPTHNAVQKFFQTYITARQMCDDLYDWQEDMSKKHITPISDFLYEKIYKHNNTSYQSLALQEAYHEIYISIDRLLQKSLFHLEKAGVFKKKSPLEKMIVSLQTSVEHQAQSIFEVEQFINEYFAL